MRLPRDHCATERRPTPLARDPFDKRARTNESGFVFGWIRGLATFNYIFIKEIITVRLYFFGF